MSWIVLEAGGHPLLFLILRLSDMHSLQYHHQTLGPGSTLGVCMGPENLLWNDVGAVEGAQA